MRNIVGLILVCVCVLGAQAQKVKLTIPTSHSEPVKQLAVTSDGKYCASVSIKSLMIWEVATQKKIHELNFDFGGQDDGYTLTLSKNLTKVIISSRKGMRCYDIQTGKKLFEDNSTCGGATFNADDSKIFGVKLDYLIIYDANTGKEEKSIKGVIDRSSDACKLYNLQGDRLLVISEYGWGIVKLKTDELAFTYKIKNAYSDRFSGYDYSVTDNVIVTIGEKFIATYDPLSAKEIKRKTLPYGSISLCTTDNGEVVLFSDDFKTKTFKSEVIRVSDLLVIKTSKQPTSKLIESIFFAKNCIQIPGTNNILYSNLTDLYYFNTRDGKFTAANENNVTDFKNFYYDQSFIPRVLPDNGLEFSTNDNGLRVFNLENYRPDKFILGTPYSVYSADGKLMAGIGKVIFIKNKSTGDLIKTLPLPPNVVPEQEIFFFSPDNAKLFFSNRSTGLLYALNLGSGAVEKILTFEPGFLGEVTLDGKYYALEVLIGKQHHIKVYNLTTRKEVMSFKNCDITTESGCLDAFRFLNDSYLLLVADQNGKVNIYKADDPTYKKTFELKDLTYRFYLAGVDIKNNVIALGQDILGSYALQLYNLQGEALERYSAVNDDRFLTAAFSVDGKVMFTPTTQQGVQAWDRKTGKLVGTYYFIKKSKEYIFVTPDGLFDGSIEGMKELYYVKNNKTIPLEKLYEKFYTPDLLRRLINGEKFLPPDLANLRNPPKVKIMYAEATRNLEVEDDIPTYKNSTGLADISVTASSDDDNVDEIRLFHNGKIVTLTTRNLIVEDNKGNAQTKKYQLALLPGTNNIRAISLNTQRTESDPDDILVSYFTNGSTAPPIPVDNRNSNSTLSNVDKNATMYLMVVGINAYTNKINPLTYAIPDAKAFKEEIEKDAKSILGNVKTYFITDAAADKAGIVNAFAEIKKLAKPEDVLVFYYAGHGYIEPGSKEFYLVSSNVTDAGASLLQNGIPAKDLQQYAIDIQAQKQLFVLDACQSAGAFDVMLKHDGEQQKSLGVVARATGTHWMAASGSLETAKEFGELGHGAFTYVLLQALKGQAAANKMITVNGLKNFLQVQVPELVKKYGSNNQYPASYGFGNDFPVEIVK